MPGRRPIRGGADQEKDAEDQEENSCAAADPVQGYDAGHGLADQDGDGGGAMRARRSPGGKASAWLRLCLVPVFRRLGKRELVRRLERGPATRVDVRVYTSKPWELQEVREERDGRPRSVASEGEAR